MNDSQERRESELFHAAAIVEALRSINVATYSGATEQKIIDAVRSQSGPALERALALLRSLAR
jgi:hypothetical protein